ncbi:uncharacterized protein LOC128679475 [Plodia interpunctella]|uniref:uncharacterized protein LOC128679475 n=1 Tax=Plodia interpunctella TaxID=58824 RepID=UPI0023684898|nr:uncharacterized protein LOC128679475 [Plodia interpunctella]
MQNKIFAALTLTKCLQRTTSTIVISTRTAVNLSYKVLGANTADPEKTPIMLIHGLFGNKRIWHSMGKVMKNTMKRLVITVDLRNHGVSPHTKSHTYEKMVGDIQRLYKKLSINEAYLVGYCMGGMTAMVMALLAPEQVAGLIVVEVSPASTSPIFESHYYEVMKAMKAVEFKSPKNVRKARKQAKEQLQNLIKDDHVMTAILSNIKIKKDNTIGWTCNLDVLLKHFKYMTVFPASLKGKKYRGPTLFIGGQISDFIPPDDLTKIRMYFPQAIVHYVAKTGHFIHVDDPKSFMELVMKFVKQSSSSQLNGMDSLCYAVKKILKFRLKPLTSHMVKRGAVNLAYKVHGKQPSDGIPVIILHGLLGSKRNWESMSKKIASELNKSVVAVDIRNHGESPHVGSHTYPELAEDVVQLLRTLSVSKADLIGHSMGGRTGMVVALTEPTKVSHLVVVDISPVSTAGILNDFFPKLIDIMKSSDIESQPNITAAKNIAKEKIYASGLVPPNAPIHFILMNIGTRPDKKIGWNCNLDVLKQHFENIATFPSEMAGKSFDGPTLFVGGEESNYIPREDLPGIKNFFPKADLKYVPKAGHNVHAEDPNTFFKLVQEFLTRR